VGRLESGMRHTRAGAFSGSVKPIRGKEGTVPSERDGPPSSLFRELSFTGNRLPTELAVPEVSQGLVDNLQHAPTGDCTAWGIPFRVSDRVVVAGNSNVSIAIGPIQARWLVVLHTADGTPSVPNDYDHYPPPATGMGSLNEHVANYVAIYDDGTEKVSEIRYRHQIGMYGRGWRKHGLQCVPHRKPFPLRAHHEQTALSWAQSQTRVDLNVPQDWVSWLWAWENPCPEMVIVGLRIEPVGGAVLLSAISATDVDANPLRWVSRRKAVLTLPDGTAFDPVLGENGCLTQLQLDMGQVISATPRPLYPNDQWSQTYSNKLPQLSQREILVEYTAHPDAAFHLFDGTQVPVSRLVAGAAGRTLRPVAPALKKIRVRVIDQTIGRPVPVKLHLHGEADEYLPPVDRHRQVNPCWFEDYAPDFVHMGLHNCTYIPGETHVKLPIGKVYAEVSKGFEVRPLRAVLDVTPETTELTIPIEKVLPWREKGWVSADTHVHFLSPGTALLEGAAEDVNVINLLASQWGELLTNVGDFDGRTAWGSRESGGDGEYLVRVGSENRQQLMGHISLLGYDGPLITPLATGGPNESALGDPIETLLTEWAKQCKDQNGVVVLPHFPYPRLEHAAAIVSGNIDAVEMTSGPFLYGGINPYSLTDWYRFLNCGYFTAAVGGTDKMTAMTAVGTSRTYAKLADGCPFDYPAWKEAITNGHTFVTYGPLLEFTVDGAVPGSQIAMSRSGGTVDVTYELASVTVPMSRVELVVNGVVQESREVDPWRDRGSWSVKISRSSWLALLVRGHYLDKPEIISAHSSPVMVPLERSAFYAAADALNILQQIEGALALLDTIGTRAETDAYKRMRMVLVSQRRSVHNRMHEHGQYHTHSPVVCDS
jgi:hypothetical protein